MANSFFQFKQFTIRHDLCAMKVGTDGVLLGAWASLSDTKTLLDVGTGTGLISLMIAQRRALINSTFHIDAIDIDKDAARQATLNTEASPFQKYITVSHIPFLEYSETVDKKYDLIVSNPPYFSHSLKCPDTKRSTARHNDSLPLEELITGCRALLSPHGKIALILPSEQEKEIELLATQNNVFFLRKTYVVPTLHALPKRILIELSDHPETDIQIEWLVIEKSRHQYTEEYIALTKDFYLKM